MEMVSMVKINPGAFVEKFPSLERRKHLTKYVGQAQELLPCVSPASTG